MNEPFEYRVRILASDFRYRDSDTSRSGFRPRRGLYYKFFYKPKLKLDLGNVQRRTHNHLTGQPVEQAIVLDARILNDGRGIAKNARIHLQIEGITSDYEIHPWHPLNFASVSGGGYTQALEVNILQNGYALSFITSVSPTLDYAFTVTLFNQMTGQKGYKLELDKEYTVYIQVSGDFTPKRWGFKITPTTNGTEFTNPIEVVTH